MVLEPLDSRYTRWCRPLSDPSFSSPSSSSVVFPDNLQQPFIPRFSSTLVYCLSGKMQIKNPMNLSNLLNSEPTALKPTDLMAEINPSLHNRNDFTSVNAAPGSSDYSDIDIKSIYSIPSPPASEYSPTNSHQKFEFPYSSPTVQQLYTPPIAKCQLAFRPRQNSDHSQSNYSDYQPQNEYRQDIQLPSIGTLNIELNLRSTHHQPNRHPSYEQYPRLVSSHRHSKPESKSRYHPSASTVRERSISSRDHIRKPNQRRPPKKKNSPHSNSKYAKEHVHYVRYFKIDWDYSYAKIQLMFDLQFPEEKRDTDQCFSSRTYRDHVIPVVNENWDLTFTNQGKVVTKDSKVRKKNEPEFQLVPFDLVSRLPHKALEYSWVSGHHKRKALAIIEQDQRDAALGCLSGMSSPSHLDIELC